MKALIAVVAVAILGLIGATLWIGGALFEEKVTAHPFEEGLRWDEQQKKAARPDCDLSAGPCERAAGDLRLSLEAAPRPLRSMTELAFTVRASRGGGPVALEGGSIAFAMPGMYMGENRIALAPGEGGLRGKWVLVRCPSGSRTWSAEVVVRPAAPPGAAPLRATFTFELSP